jgi:hypothetical protein
MFMVKRGLATLYENIIVKLNFLNKILFECASNMARKPKGMLITNFNFVRGFSNLPISARNFDLKLNSNLCLRTMH